jgi:hypothetical protein
VSLRYCCDVGGPVTLVIIVSTGPVIDDSRRAVTFKVIAGSRCVVTVAVIVVSRRNATVTVIVVSGDGTVSWSAASMTVAVLVAVSLRCGCPTVTMVTIVLTGTVINDSRRAVTVTVIAGSRYVVTVPVMVASRRDATVTVIVVSGDGTVSWSVASLTVAVMVWDTKLERR